MEYAYEGKSNLAKLLAYHCKDSAVAASGEVVERLMVSVDNVVENPDDFSVGVLADYIKDHFDVENLSELITHLSEWNSTQYQEAIETITLNLELLFPMSSAYYHEEPPGSGDYKLVLPETEKQILLNNFLEKFDQTYSRVVEAIREFKQTGDVRRLAEEKEDISHDNSFHGNRSDIYNVDFSRLWNAYFEIRLVPPFEKTTDVVSKYYDDIEAYYNDDDDYTKTSCSC